MNNNKMPAEGMSLAPAPPGVPDGEEMHDTVGFDSESTLAVDGSMTSMKILEPKNDDMNDFLKRPVQLLVTDNNSITVVTAANFFANLAVKAKMRNNMYIQGNFTFRIMTSTQPFIYGATIISHNVPGSYGTRDEIIASGGPHVIFKPQESQSIEFTIPMVYNFPYARCDDATIAQIWQITVQPLVAWKAANDAGTVTVPLVVMGYFKDYSFAIPTPSYQSAEFKPNSVVSKGAMVVKKAAQSLKNLPVIGQYATITETAASMVGNIANLFGYSRLTNITDIQIMRTIRGGRLAPTEGLDTSNKITVTQHQEIAGDVGLNQNSPEDNISILSIAQRPMIADIFTWNTTHVNGDILYQAFVDPMWNLEYGAGVYTQRHNTPLALATLPFSRWRGTIIYTFEVISSPFHRGELRITWSPTPFFPAESTLNTTHSCVLDISNGSTVEMQVGWGRGNALTSTVGLSPSEGTSNGFLMVTVNNALSAPIAAASIKILVWMRAGDDYFVAIPNTQSLLDLVHYTQFPGYLSDYNPNTLTTLTAPAAGPTIAYQAASFQVAMKPNSHVCHINNNVNLDIPVEKICFGESVRSFRPLLSRYVRNFIFYPIPSNLNAHSLPRWPKPTEVIGTRVGYATQTYFHYLAPCFAGARGAAKYKIHTQKNTQDEIDNMQIIVSYERTSYYVGTQHVTTPPMTNPAFLQNLARQTQGALLLTPSEGIIEVETPSYNSALYTSTSSLYNTGNLGAGLLLTTTSPGSGVSTPVPFVAYVSMSPDTSFHYWAGPPIMYLWRLADA